jgi:hypothetical protein
VGGLHPRLPRVSNSMDNLRVASMDFLAGEPDAAAAGAEASTPSGEPGGAVGLGVGRSGSAGGGGGARAGVRGETSTPRGETSTPTMIPGAESPSRRSNIGGKLTALKRRQENRRAQSANLLSTPRTESRISTAPDMVGGDDDGGGGVGSVSAPPRYPDSGTPLGHSYLTGRGGGDGALAALLDASGAGPGHTSSRVAGHALAGRRAAGGGGVVGVVGGVGSLAQRRNHPGVLDVSTSGEYGAGGGGGGFVTPDSVGSGGGVFSARGPGSGGAGAR